jgi:hypothetical protein
MRKSCVVLLAVPSLALAQVPLHGVAYDSLHGRPLSGAFVQVMGTTISAVSDSLGRFTLANVPTGPHRVAMQHDVLDAIGLFAAGTNVTVKGESDTVVVAVPSFETLWSAECNRALPQGRDSSFVFGTVSRGSRSVPFAQVATTWGATGSLETAADSAGNFALCGVPGSASLKLRASSGNTYGSWIDVVAIGDNRIARRDLKITTAAPMRFDVPATTTFTGTALDSMKTPVADAEVSIPDLGLVASTDARGNFRITGVAVGRHSVRVRKIGYDVVDQSVVFAAGAVTEKALVLSRITTLDSVNVTARNAPVDEAMRLFEENRKIGLGKFLTRDDLEKSRDRRMGDLLAQMPGVKTEGGSGGQAWLLSTRGNRSIDPTSRRCTPPVKQDSPEGNATYRAKPVSSSAPLPPCTNYCYPHIFLDGVDLSPTEIPNINRFAPSDFEAVEYYAGASQVPPEYNRLNKAVCGLVVLHSRRGKKGLN